MLSRSQRAYHGHPGMRLWVAHVARADLARGATMQRVDIAEIRVGRDRGVILLGQIVLDTEPMGPFSMLMRASGGLVIEARGFLSDESLLQTIGMLG